MRVDRTRGKGRSIIRRRALLWTPASTLVQKCVADERHRAVRSKAANKIGSSQAGAAGRPRVHTDADDTGRSLDLTFDACSNPVPTY